MLRSNVIRYAVLAVSANKHTSLFQQDCQVGLAVLGLYELEERKFIYWDKSSACHFSNGMQEEPLYLLPLLWSSFFVTLVAKKYRLATMLPFVPRMVCDSR